MAGDRGLAFVFIGLISLSTLWIGRNHRAASESKTASVTTANPPTPGDARFLAKAVQQNLAQGLLGDLARQKGSQTIRHLATSISVPTDSELRRLASLQGIKIPGAIDSENLAAYDYLASLAGETFDRKYTAYELRVHQLVAAELQREAALGRYPELKRFASENLPAEEQRLLLLENTAARLSAGGPIE